MEKREPSCTVGGYVSCCSHCGNSVDVPQKMENRTTVRSSNLPSVYISEGNEISLLKTYLHLHTSGTIICEIQHMETTEVSPDG